MDKTAPQSMAKPGGSGPHAELIPFHIFIVHFHSALLEPPAGFIAKETLLVFMKRDAHEAHSRAFALSLYFPLF